MIPKSYKFDSGELKNGNIRVLIVPKDGRIWLDKSYKDKVMLPKDQWVSLEIPKDEIIYFIYDMMDELLKYNPKDDGD